MSDQPSENHLRTLILKWRERAYQKRGTFHLHSERSIQAMRQCADELEAALAEGVPPAEPKLLCSGCGCSKALCLEYKLNGAVACCPDCNHWPESASVPLAEPGVPGSEVLCEACAKVFCPHGERLHFHHDGCPACCPDCKQIPF
jgi:hypothetical protein